MFLAHKLGLELPRGAEQEEAITVARAVLRSQFPDLTPECTDVVLRSFIDQVDQAPSDLPPSTLADPSLLDILFEMEAQLPDGLSSDTQSVLAAARRHVSREACWTHPRYKASWGKHNECACINQCSGLTSWAWSNSR